MGFISRSIKVVLVRIVAALHIVDRDYYSASYPDIAAAGCDPVEHYVLYGFREGRSPNRITAGCKAAVSTTLRNAIMRATGFDQAFYLAQYPDVALAGVDPLTHYLRYGFSEGRRRNERKVRFKKTLIFFQAVLAFANKRNRPALARHRHEFVFELARNGSRLWVRLLMWFERFLSSRSGTKIFARCLPLTNLTKDQVDGISITHVAPARPYSFYEPKIVDENALRPYRTVEVPAKWVATVAYASIVGGFQVVAGRRFVQYEPAANPHSDFVAGSWPFARGVTGSGFVAVWYPYERKAVLEEGILLSGRCSPNYYHWLIEYLGRLYTILQRPELRGVPLIVDAQMYPQEFESLAAMCPDWPIYRLDRRTMLKVTRLHIPSIPTFLPDSVRIPFWKGSTLCDESLTLIRDTVLNRYGIHFTKPLTRKIFLVRRGARTILDVEELEAALVDMGFECIDTGVLTFEEQVRLFAEAAMIVGPLGAAFTNAIFCHPDCKVLGLASPYVKRFCLQGNLAEFAGCEYRILAGDHPSYRRGDEYAMEDVATMHSNFSIPVEKLVLAIEDWLGEARDAGAAAAG
ncbi:hypothetical protein BZM27_05335 [Paraburkholderia steynii]|uniref:Glycosyltransferase 61 catalytic domain-containing protein n=1 Tax=Paraburkholderia steynii TaxID=1245441 RepID=A0A4R0XPI9_9BURK|nr:hypothetical protein BZM27_05335 [Paraburkholderia steynii]